MPRQDGRLVRHEAKARAGRGKIRIDLFRPLLEACPQGLIRKSDIGVDDERALEELRIFVRDKHGDAAAETVSHQGHRLSARSSRSVACTSSTKSAAAVLGPGAAVAHAAEIDGNDPIVAGEPRRDEVPPMRMAAKAVQQQHDPRVGRLAPLQVVRSVIAGFQKWPERPGVSIIRCTQSSATGALVSAEVKQTYSTAPMGCQALCQLRAAPVESGSNPHRRMPC